MRKLASAVDSHTSGKATSSSIMRCSIATRAVTTAGAFDRVCLFSTVSRDRHRSTHARASREMRSPGASRPSLPSRSTKDEKRCAHVSRRPSPHGTSHAPSTDTRRPAGGPPRTPPPPAAPAVPGSPFPPGAASSPWTKTKLGSASEALSAHASCSSSVGGAAAPRGGRLGLVGCGGSARRPMRSAPPAVSLAPLETAAATPPRTPAATPRPPPPAAACTPSASDAAKASASSRDRASAKASSSSSDMPRGSPDEASALTAPGSAPLEAKMEPQS
eukprot:scaffold19860_cov81-Isochrysis_galbana.AAC.2